MRNFGLVLSALAQQQQLSQNEFAKLVGLDQATISRINTGKIKFSPEAGREILKAFARSREDREVIVRALVRDFLSVLGLSDEEFVVPERPKGGDIAEVADPRLYALLMGFARAVSRGDDDLRHLLETIGEMRLGKLVPMAQTMRVAETPTPSSRRAAADRAAKETPPPAPAKSRRKAGN